MHNLPDADDSDDNICVSLKLGRLSTSMDEEMGSHDG